jgi:uncharacterized protein
MKLEQSFTVTAPIDQVWEALVDVERIAPCLPGAELTGQGPDGAYQGTFSVKLGPTTAAYRGSLKMEELDEASHTATMKANGSDKRGQGGAHATIVSKLLQEGEQTKVDVDTDFTITGRLARFGRSGMIEDISKRLLRDFASCLEAMITAGPPAGAGHPEAVAAGAAAAAVPAPGAPEAGPDTPAQAAAAVASAGGAAGEASAAASSPAGPPRPAPQPAKPVHGISLFFSVLWERIKRVFSRNK